jgi:Uma2 family endonuclease
MSASVSTPFTYRDYARLPDDRRFEVIEGKLFLTPAPRTSHQRICGELFAALREHVRRHDLGEVLIAPCDLVLSETNVLQPDILFVRRDRLSIIGEKYVSAAPDLLVEVLSPRTRTRDRKLKLRLYARFGVRELWVADGDSRSIEVFESADGRFRLRKRYQAGQALRSKVLPKLRLSVVSIF